uniref:Uncharacterized protein n=1 Tax=Rhizophora mucronata TaxID=61149 RepID=A0A2P2KGE3_RHIMU
MAFSLYSSSFIHPQLRHVVAKMTVLDTLLFYVTHFVDKLGLWHRLPVLLGLAYLGIRRHLHQRYNLLQVGGLYGHKYNNDEFCYRTADGKCNHPSDDTIGSYGTFFGRNMPPATSTYGVRVCTFYLSCFFSVILFIFFYSFNHLNFLPFLFF